jgi:hypothetical protein
MQTDSYLHYLKDFRDLIQVVSKIKKREFTDLQLSPVWVQLKLAAVAGKKYSTGPEATVRLFRTTAADGKQYVQEKNV